MKLKKKIKKVKTPGPTSNKSFHTILGFRAIARPKYIETLEFPAQTLTSLDASNVSELHAKYSLLYAYANQRFTQVEVKILRLNREREDTENAIFRENPALSALDKWRKEAKINSFKAIGFIDRQVTMAQIERRTLQGLRENYISLIAALSRELSRRQFSVRPTEGF